MIMEKTNCGVDKNLLEAFFDTFLLDRLPKLKELMCCEGDDNGGGSGGGTPTPPGVDVFVSNLAITDSAKTAQDGTVTTTYTVELTLNNGAKLSDKFDVVTKPSDGGNNGGGQGGDTDNTPELYIEGFSATETVNNDGNPVYRLTLTRNDLKEFTQDLPIYKSAAGGVVKEFKITDSTHPRGSGHLLLTDSDGKEWLIDQSWVRSTLWRSTVNIPKFSDENTLPTQMVGGRTHLLGYPDHFVPINVDGRECLMPVYFKHI